MSARALKWVHVALLLTAAGCQDCSRKPHRIRTVTVVQDDTVTFRNLPPGWRIVPNDSGPSQVAGSGD